MNRRSVKMATEDPKDTALIEERMTHQISPGDPSGIWNAGRRRGSVQIGLPGRFQERLRQGVAEGYDLGVENTVRIGVSYAT